MRERLVVVGGGIAGLAAAHAARAAKPASELEILLLEADDQLGGKARSYREDDWLVEEGPTGYLDTEPVMDRLVALAGLTKRPADKAAARRFLVRDGVLREIEAHPLKFFASGILSPFALARLTLEPFIAKRVDPTEESAFDFAARRLGRQAAERLISPMVLGVYAGDAKRISLPAAFPKMAELEREYGSLVRALISKKRKRTSSGGGPAGPGGELCSFDDGLQSFLRALGERGEFDVRTSSPVDLLAHDGECWRVRSAGEPLRADRVVLATEAWTAKTLLTDLLPDAARALAEIHVPHVAVVALGYGPEAAQLTPRGFGALIQRSGGLRSLGVLWDTNLFAHRGPNDSILMRAMVGGRTDPEAAQLSDDELLTLVESELARLLHLPAPPTFRHVKRWPLAIPQYELGHLDLARRVREDLARSNAKRPGLQLAGNYLDGVAFAKAAASGWRAGAGEQ
ncbi:MAG: protoporphyrinogen oxidase [Planctomycetes bacterium]|nr:protoporphyrinogen oxidase [Planctomycetota bacterium]MCB9903785.1 protoporphyrinogen oxidase [Planctomycetota bacterium]